MGFVGDLVGGILGAGGGGGGGGSNFRAQAAPIIQGVTAPQVGQAYNQTNQGLSQQQAFLNALQGQNGIGNQSNVFAQQQGLANQLQGLANGTGPNPAMAQLANTTGQNVANQAAMMAGQRGSGANVGMLARQIGQQGAGIQQNAAGQAAALQAQQQLNALGALQQQQGMMGNLAGSQVAQQQQGLTGYNQFAQGQQQNLLNALGQYNDQQVNMQSNMNNANAGIQTQVAKGQGDMFKGVAGAVGKGIMGLFADGGMVNGPQSVVGRFMNGAPMMAQGGPVMMNSYGAGQMVPGKAAVPGNSLKNDKVPAMLSPKEIVIPRSITMSKDAPQKAAEFVAAILAKNGMKK